MGTALANRLREAAGNSSTERATRGRHAKPAPEKGAGSGALGGPGRHPVVAALANEAFSRNCCAYPCEHRPPRLQYGSGHARQCSWQGGRTSAERSRHDPVNVAIREDLGEIERWKGNSLSRQKKAL